MPPETAPAAEPHSKNRARDVESWATLKRFLPYLWPRDNPGLRTRIVIAMALVLAAKAVTLALPSPTRARSMRCRLRERARRAMA